MSVKAAQREVSSKEFAEWMAYHRIDPIEPLRSDFRFAMIASIIANIGGRKKGTRAFKIEDFMPKFGAEREQSQDEIKNNLNLWLKMFRKGRADDNRKHSL